MLSHIVDYGPKKKKILTFQLLYIEQYSLKLKSQQLSCEK